MALISSIKKHAKENLVGYIKQATKLFHGSLDGDRTPKAKDKAKAIREIPNAPIHVISEPATTTAITGAHLGDTEVVPNEGYDYSLWTWNELSPILSELPAHSKPLTASTSKLQGQEPTVNKADKTFLELATTADSIARVFESASEPSSFLTTTTSSSTSSSTSTHTETAINAIATTSTPDSSDALSLLTRFIWVSKPYNPLYSSVFPSSPTRFERSPFFGKKLGPTPRVSRIPSASCALDPEAPASGSSASIKTAGSTMVVGFENKPEGHTGDDESTPGFFEAFGGLNGGRPFVEILAELRTLFHHKLPSSVCNTSSPSPLLIEEGYELAFAKIREIRACLGRMEPVSR